MGADAFGHQGSTMPCPYSFSAFICGLSLCDHRDCRVHSSPCPFRKKRVRLVNLVLVQSLFPSTWGGGLSKRFLLASVEEDHNLLAHHRTARHSSAPAYMESGGSVGHSLSRLSRILLEY